MCDKLDETIDSVASSGSKLDSEGTKSPKKASKTELVDPELKRKRKIAQIEIPDRPNTLETTKKIKLEAEPSSSFEMLEEPNCSFRRYEHSRSMGSEEFEENKKRSYSEEQENTRFKKIQSPRDSSITETDPTKTWTAFDDLVLITAISHISCLKFVYNSLPFSRKFSYSDLEERFCQLMYDKDMSDAAKKRIEEMPYRLRAQIESRTPFSRSEEKCLMESAEAILKAARKDKNEAEMNHTLLRIEHFKKILESNKHMFHQKRTPQVLSDHFRRIKGYKEKNEISESYNWQALETPADGVNMDFDILNPLQSCRSRYYAISRRPALRGVLNRFQTSASVPDNAIAMIHGQFLQFAMTGRVVVMGRATMTEKVDIDLSKEGPAAKVSRQQAIICHLGEDVFTIQNIGQRAMYVDSKPLPQMVTTSLKHGSIIEIAALRLIFSIPVPRVLHPLTRQCAQHHRQVALEQKQQQQQQLPQRSAYGTPTIPPPPRKSRGKLLPMMTMSSNQGMLHKSANKRAGPLEKEKPHNALA